MVRSDRLHEESYHQSQRKSDWPNITARGWRGCDSFRAFPIQALEYDTILYKDQQTSQQWWGEGGRVGITHQSRGVVTIGEWNRVLYNTCFLSITRENIPKPFNPLFLGKCSPQCEVNTTLNTRGRSASRTWKMQFSPLVGEIPTPRELLVKLSGAGISPSTLQLCSSSDKWPKRLAPWEHSLSFSLNSDLVYMLCCQPWKPSLGHV